MQSTSLTLQVRKSVSAPNESTVLSRELHVYSAVLVKNLFRTLYSAVVGQELIMRTIRCSSSCSSWSRVFKEN